MSQVYFKKEGMTNYMIIPCEYELAEDYQSCLLKHYTVPYFLQYEKREMNGKQSLYYRLKYRTSLESVLGHLQLTYPRLKNILASIVGVMETAEEYLLESDRIMWKADRIFLEADTGKLQFCYCPVEEEEKGCLKELLMQIIQEVDKKEEESVLFILQFYNMITEPDCQLEDLKRYVGKQEDDTGVSRGTMSYAVEEEFRLDDSFWSCKNPARSEENFGTGKPEPSSGNNRKENGKRQKASSKMNSERGSKGEDDKGTKAEKVLCILLIGTAGINFILIICLLFNILTYDYVRYLFISMAVLIALTIVYMHVSKEETPDEIMQAFFENDSSVWNDNFDMSACGETGVLAGGDTMDKNKEVIVTEEYNVRLYLESMEKEKYEPVHLNKKSVVLGAMPDSCDYILKERGVSRMHAKLMEKLDGIYLLDLNSTNGTYLNGELIESGQEYKLEEGDMVTFALCEFYVAEEKV